ncbi:MAG: 30S ribosomal protein S20 [Phycisphaerae bacterium]
MANRPSSKKRIRQNARRHRLNNWRRDRIKTAVRAFDEAVTAGDAATAGEKLQACYKELDRVAAKGTIHKNQASRRKARLAKRLNAISQG